jgi:hypothetical protein
VAGKTPKEAADNFIHYLKESLSCLSSHYVTAYQQTDKLYKIFYEPYAIVPARNTNRYQVSIIQIFKTIPDPKNEGEFKATTREYSYVLLTGDGETEIASYHWHPHDPGVHYPHLHVHSVERIHFPTSRVCLEDFIFMLFRDYDVRRNLPQAECKRILDKNKRAFEKSATWKVQH